MPDTRDIIGGRASRTYGKMRLSFTKSDRTPLRLLAVLFLLVCGPLSTLRVPGQQVPGPASVINAQAAASETDSIFRVEKVPVAGGSEIVTIFARFRSAAETRGEIPLISVLRDTLGDEKSENDRLRYVWLHTYTRPSLSQKISAVVPFLYTRTTNKGKPGTGPPPALIDVQTSDKALWDRVLWQVFKRFALNRYGIGARASGMQYHQNVADYRRTAIAEALTVLSLYQDVGGEKVLSDTELHDVQARLSLDDKMFGWHMQSEYLGRVHEKQLTAATDVQALNWELLRQYAEGQGLYFDPIEMADGRPRHAIVWTTAEDVKANEGKRFDGRFLNVKNPWTDPELRRWRGYSEVRWFDADDRVVEPGTPKATPRTMIPLAVYGLENPKIPVLLVDFRDNSNPRRREMTRRVLHDVTVNVLALSRFSTPAFFVGKFVYDFATGRRGMDINQPSRLRSYAQLKLLLLLDASLDPEFRNEIGDRIEWATLNPLQNDTDVETRLARSQYENLLAFAARADGLSVRIAKDRREEMVRLKHGGLGRSLFTLAHVMSLGTYTHREKATSEMVAQMDKRRQLDHHERRLREIAASSARPEVDGSTAALKDSLSFISENGAAAGGKTSRALATIFAMTADDDVRTLCLTGLYRINNASAKQELLAIYRDVRLADGWRSLCARYLKLALVEGQRIRSRDADVIAGIASD